MVLGFGMGNYRDGTLKQLASRGNGNYGYIDTIEEAQKMPGDQMTGTLVTIAQDVKIQVEFNPATVGACRLLGYENRIKRSGDFNDDTVDAGDIGAGHTVTAFYELIPPGEEAAGLPAIYPLKYSPGPVIPPSPAYADELLTVKVRYKLPKETGSRLLSFPVKTASARKARDASPGFNSAASVAAFGMLLRDSPYKGNADFDMVLAMADSSLGEDRFDYRRAFLNLAEAAKKIRPAAGK
jgi:Ca-activated chloride channel family protein